MINSNQPSNSSFKGIFHIVLGILYVLVGILVVYFEKNNFIEVGEIFSYAIALLFIAYGIFRIYRGYTRITDKSKTW